VRGARLGVGVWHSCGCGCVVAGRAVPRAPDRLRRSSGSGGAGVPLRPWSPVSWSPAAVGASRR